MEETMWRRFWRMCSGWATERDRRNERKMIGWIFAWMASWVGVSGLITADLVPPGIATYAAVLVPTVLGVAAVVAFVKFLREADELQRKIQLDALALGFGVGMVAAVSWELLEELGFAEGDPSYVLLFMVVAYTLGILFGARRYR